MRDMKSIEYSVCKQRNDNARLPGDSPVVPLVGKSLLTISRGRSIMAVSDAIR